MAGKYNKALRDESHDLMGLGYSRAAIERASIVQPLLGGNSNYIDVCNYYHNLQAMERNLTPAQLKSSHEFEYRLLSGGPPTSLYQQNMFPNLYKTIPVDIGYPIESKIYNESPSVSSKDDFVFSPLIHNYYMIDPKMRKRFVQQFKAYAHIHGINPTAGNIALFVEKRKTLLEKAQRSNSNSKFWMENEVELQRRAIVKANWEN